MTIILDEDKVCYEIGSLFGAHNGITKEWNVKGNEMRILFGMCLKESVEN